MVGYPAAAEAVAAAQFDGEVLAWNDPLHEGPVPGELSNRELAELRARALEQLGYGIERQWWEAWTARDQRFVAALQRDKEWVLWFEPVLVDQLQEIDLLRRLTGEPKRPSLWVVPAPEGLAQLQPSDLIALFSRAELLLGDLSWAGRSWQAFSGDNPAALLGLMRDPELPAPAQRALKRWLEEFPDSRDGLTRTERSLLELLQEGPLSEADLFGQHQARDSWHPVGDAVLRSRLEELARGRRPLVENAGSGVWRLSREGQEVLAGRLHRLDVSRLDRWFGGARLVSPERVWMLDRAKGTFQLQPHRPLGLVAPDDQP